MKTIDTGKRTRKWKKSPGHKFKKLKEIKENEEHSKKAYPPS